MWMDTQKIISLLGGNAKTAELCQVTPGAVSQWLHSGIPKHQLKFLKLARPDVFKELESQEHLAPNRRDDIAPEPGLDPDEPPTPGSLTCRIPDQPLVYEIAK